MAHATAAIQFLFSESAASVTLSTEAVSDHIHLLLFTIFIPLIVSLSGSYLTNRVTLSTEAYPCQVMSCGR